MRTGRSQLVSGDVDAVVLRPDDSLDRARVALAQARHDLGVVVDDGTGVLGTISDAILRRAVMNGVGLGSPVAAVMTTDPVVVDARASDEAVYELLKTHRLRSVPVVDDGRLVGARSFDGFPPVTTEPAAIIMAGGRGQRLRPFTDKVPKPLLRVGSTSIVERLIQRVAAAGVRHVFLAVNYMADVFEQRLGSGAHLGVTLEYLRETHPMGTAGALTMLSADRWGPLLVSNGDIVTTVAFDRLFDFHWRHGGAMTLAGVEHRSPIPYGVLNTAGDVLLGIEEKPERRDLCSAGIYVLDPLVLRLLPSKVPLDMPEVVGAVLSAGLPVHVFPVLEKWFDIGGTAQFEQVLLEFALGEEE